MTPEIINSDNVFAGQVFGNLDLDLLSLGEPSEERLVGRDEPDFEDDGPVRLRRRHHGADGFGRGVQDIPTAKFNVFGQFHPLNIQTDLNPVLGMFSYHQPESSAVKFHFVALCTVAARTRPACKSIARRNNSHNNINCLVCETGADYRSPAREFRGIPHSRFGATERAAASVTNGHAMRGDLAGVMSGGSQPLPSELNANAVRSRRDCGERPASNSAGLAHGEHPIVNRKAGVLSASGSTPPSSITHSARSKSPTVSARDPAVPSTPYPPEAGTAGRGGANG